VIGFEQSISPFLKPHHTKALVFGTGGASAAVVFVLKKLGN
jgi:shikimate dehydrogenase